MLADVTIEGSAGSETLIVPTEALIRTGRAQRVIIALGNGRFVARDVESEQVDQVGIAAARQHLEAANAVGIAAGIQRLDGAEVGDLLEQVHHRGHETHLWLRKDICQLNHLNLQQGWRVQNLTHFFLSVKIFNSLCFQFIFHFH